jgi:hypothetical protein
MVAESQETGLFVSPRTKRRTMGAPEKRSLERAQRAEERSLGAASHEKC